MATAEEEDSTALLQVFESNAYNYHPAALVNIDGVKGRGVRALRDIPCASLVCLFPGTETYRFPACSAFPREQWSRRGRADAVRAFEAAESNMALSDYACKVSVLDFEMNHMRGDDGDDGDESDDGDDGDESDDGDDGDESSHERCALREVGYHWRVLDPFFDDPAAVAPWRADLECGFGFDVHKMSGHVCPLALPPEWLRWAESRARCLLEDGDGDGGGDAPARIYETCGRAGCAHSQLSLTAKKRRNPRLLQPYGFYKRIFCSCCEAATDAASLARFWTLPRPKPRNCGVFMYLNGELHYVYEKHEKHAKHAKHEKHEECGGARSCCDEVEERVRGVAMVLTRCLLDVPAGRCRARAAHLREQKLRSDYPHMGGFINEPHAHEEANLRFCDPHEWIPRIRDGEMTVIVSRGDTRRGCKRARSRDNQEDDPYASLRSVLQSERDVMEHLAFLQRPALVTRRAVRKGEELLVKYNRARVTPLPHEGSARIACQTKK